MGTHPIFESDFDCLTGEMSNADSRIPEKIEDSVIREKYVCDGKLNCQIRCPMCPSKILPIKSAKLVEFSKKLPAFTTDLDEDEINLWWSVDDMFTFDNIGFSKSKDGIKYLTCADCEVGPLGFHDPTEAPLRFLIAACRVKYDE